MRQIFFVLYLLADVTNNVVGILMGTGVSNTLLDYSGCFQKYDIRRLISQRLEFETNKFLCFQILHLSKCVKSYFVSQGFVLEIDLRYFRFIYIKYVHSFK